MRILQIHKYYWPRDGASKYMLQLEALLRGAGHEVIPFAMQEKETLATPFQKYFVSEMDLSSTKKVSLGKKIGNVSRMFYSREAKRKIAQLLDEHPVDIVHLHNIYHHISPSILHEIKKRGIPVVMTLHDYKLVAPNYTLFHHGSVHEEDARGWYLSCVANKCMKDSRSQSLVVALEMIWHHKVMRYYERYVDRFIAPSQFIADLCVRFGWPKEKFVHIVHPYDALGHTHKQEGSGSVTYIGRLSEEKGLLTLLDAAGRTPEIPYLIVGTGPLLSVLQKRVQREQLHNVTFAGFLSGEALERCVADASLIVVPSVWYENYPLAILEATMAGKVVLGSRIGGIGEMLPPDLLFAPGDAGDLAKQIKTWYGTSLSEREKKGQELRENTLQVNDPTCHLKCIEELYETLL